MKRQLIGAAAVALFLTGCSKLTTENYDKLKMGMAVEEVESIIGGADNCSESLGTKTCVWGNEDAKHIKVSFVADNAVAFSNDGLK